MYYTSRSYIYKAGMDGSSGAVIISGLSRPSGIIVDMQSLRLYWAGSGDTRIQSANLDGTSVRNIATSASGSYGITLLNERVYWGQYSANTIQSSTINGTDMRVEHSGTVTTRHFAVPIWNLPRNRTNPCEQRACSVCVLTPTSFSCLATPGMDPLDGRFFGK